MSREGERDVLTCEMTKSRIWQIHTEKGQTNIKYLAIVQNMRNPTFYSISIKWYPLCLKLISNTYMYTGRELKMEGWHEIRKIFFHWRVLPLELFHLSVGLFDNKALLLMREERKLFHKFKFNNEGSGLVKRSLKEYELANTACIKNVSNLKKLQMQYSSYS